jgi:hypothetical protein
VDFLSLAPMESSSVLPTTISFPSTPQSTYVRSGWTAIATLEGMVQGVVVQIWAKIPALS